MKLELCHLCQPLAELSTLVPWTRTIATSQWEFQDPKMEVR